jgi:hypothetical protein
MFFIRWSKVYIVPHKIGTLSRVWSGHLLPAVGEGQDGGNGRVALTPTRTLPHRRGRDIDGSPVYQYPVA